MTRPIKAADELLFLLQTKLVESGDCPRGIAVAVVPDRTSAARWSAVFGRSARLTNPKCAVRLAKVEKELQAVYRLRR